MGHIHTFASQEEMYKCSPYPPTQQLTAREMSDGQTAHCKGETAGTQEWGLGERCPDWGALKEPECLPLSAGMRPQHRQLLNLHVRVSGGNGNEIATLQY